MARTLSRFAQFQAFAGSLLVHAGLLALFVLSLHWQGFWLPVPEAKSGDLTPLKGFTVVLTASDATIYSANSESLTAKDEQRAAEPSEAAKPG